MKVRSICCIGAGYVGGPTMAVIALKCPTIKVTVVDINHKRINAWNGPLDQLPVYEPGLAEVVGKARGRNLFFSTDIDVAIQESEMIFMAVNTPTKTEGKGAGMAADLQYVEACSEKIAEVSRSDKIVVEKSTLPVRTAEKIKEILDRNENGVSYEVLSNPEFLAEGTAIQDLFKSDRVLIGGDPTPNGQKAVDSLVEIYAHWTPREKILTTNVWSSELAKLASNAMLAQRISSINSFSALCEKTGANIEELSKAIGMDHRIGPHFLNASVGFGGSCFQKDILNLVYLCKYYGLNEVAKYWHNVIEINDYQRNRFSQKVIDHFNRNLVNRKIAILGWSFKANSNDSRESSSIYVTEKLIQEGAILHLFDPMVKFDDMLDDIDFYWKSKYQNIRNNIHPLKNTKELDANFDAIIIMTEWDEFKLLDWELLSKNSTIFDGRNIINKKIQNAYKIGCNELQKMIN